MEATEATEATKGTTKALRRVAGSAAGRMVGSVAGSAARAGAGRRAGFTLLELLVVLALMGLVAAVATPRLTQLWASVERANERAEVLAQVRALGHRAMRQGRGFVLGSQAAQEGDAGAGPPLALPEGWRVRSEPGVRYLASGVCLGGEVTLHHGDWQRTLVLEAPRCVPR